MPESAIQSVQRLTREQELYLLAQLSARMPLPEFLLGPPEFDQESGLWRRATPVTHDRQVRGQHQGSSDHQSPE